MRSKNGFTLIELLVVIAIIALLLSILLPSLKAVKEMGQGVACMANLRGLSMAFYLYAEDNDSKLAKSNQGRDNWVDKPHALNPATGNRLYTDHDSTVPEKENGIMGGTMFPYAKATKVFHCIGDRRYKVNVGSRGKGGYRSFSMPDTIGNSKEYTVTSKLTNAQYQIKGVAKYSEFVSPGDKYIFVEENYTHGYDTPGSQPLDAGFNNDVWSFWYDDVYEAWWDPLAPWHNDKTNLGYADGHVEKLVWQDNRTVIFSKDRFDPRLGTDKASCATQPNNPDQQYMSRAFPRAQD